MKVKLETSLLVDPDAASDSSMGYVVGTLWLVPGDSAGGSVGGGASKAFCSIEKINLA